MIVSVRTVRLLWFSPEFRFDFFPGIVVITVIILVVGSLWIMYNLNGRMMMPDEQMRYMLQDAG